MYEVRCLKAEDAAAFRALRLEALETYPTAFLTTAAEFRVRSLDSIADQLEHGRTWAAYSDGVPVGIAALLPISYAAAAHRAEIGAFFVTPAAQGTGAGDALVLGLKNAALDQGVWQLELFVADTNLRAQRFYERHGFETVGRLPNAARVGDVMTSDLFMVCDLR